MTGSQTCNTPASPLYDTTLKVVDATSANTVRTNLIKEIWGSTSIPTPGLPTVMQDAYAHLPSSDARYPELHALVAQLSHGAGSFKRVDMLEYKVMEGSNLIHTALAWHFIANTTPLTKNKVVILHQGHDSTLVDPNPPGADGHLGLARTMSALLADGYSVVGMYMPGFRPGDTTGSDHIALVYKTAVTSGSPIKFFMTPISVFLNYVKTQSTNAQFAPYTDFYMAGLSGGGWSTTLYSAIDPTIEYSFPVAGSVPFFMRCDNPSNINTNACRYHTPNCTMDGDAEETYTDLYQWAGYLDLYVLGSYGMGPNGVPRHQTQIVNRDDDGAYGQSFYHLSQPGNPPWDVAINCYELTVRNRLYQLGQGMYRAEIDENTTSVTPPGSGPQFHMISTGAIFRTILGELNGARRMIGRQNGNNGNPSNNDAFYRGLNGHLFHNSISGNFEEDTGIPMIGVPDAAWVSGQSSQKAFNVIAHDIHGSPILISTASTRGGWSSQTYDGTINNDPVIISGKGNGELWTFALGTDYLPYVWDVTGHHQQISTVPGLGPISASLHNIDQGFHIFYMAWDRSVQHAYKSSTGGTWVHESLGGNCVGYPAGMVASNGDLVVFNIGTDGLLYWNRKLSGDQSPGNSWTGWSPISSTIGNASSTVLTGTPAFTGDTMGGSPQNWSVFVPLPSRNLGAFFLPSTTNGSWTFSNLGGLFVGPATSHQTGAFIRGRSTGLWTWTGSGSPTLVGGLFD